MVPMCFDSSSERDADGDSVRPRHVMSYRELKGSDARRVEVGRLRPTCVSAGLRVAVKRVIASVDVAGSSDSHARRVCDFRRRVNGLPVRVRPLVGQEFDSLQMVRVRNFGARPLHFATGVEHLRRSAGGRDAIAHPVASVGHRLRTGVSSTPAVFRPLRDSTPQPPSLILQ